VIPRLAADALLIAHLAFIVFVLAGGLLVLHRRIWTAVHLPAVAWGAFAEFRNRVSPDSAGKFAAARRGIDRV